jgi:hypothetical protein
MPEVGLSSMRRRSPTAAYVVAGSRTETLEPRVLLATFTVTTTADDGPGSLRKAIVDANADRAGADVIAFDIPGGGVHTIRPQGPLPFVNMPIGIDGATQPGYAGTPLIELDGSAAGSFPGLQILGGPRTGENLIRGLAVNRFGGPGLDLAASNLRVEGCYIGVTASGDAAAPNDLGIVINSSDHLVIGGTTAAQRNVISGNGRDGIWIGPSGTGSSPGSFSVSVQGNFIGTDATGTRSLGNGGVGVRTDGNPTIGLSNIDVGGTAPGAGNVISGNRFGGVGLVNVVSGTVRGNRIGTDVSGRLALGNGGAGVLIAGKQGYHVAVGGASVPARNVISANTGPGVSVSNEDATVQGNFIGTDATGSADLGNGGDGVKLVQAVSFVQGNLISGNGGDGLHAEGVPPGGYVLGNFIGTDARGAAALGNDGDGVDLLDSGSGFPVGTLMAVSPPPPPVLNPASDGGNLISGNGGHGVRLAGTNPRSPSGLLITDYIGTDAAGAVALGNAGSGVYVASGRFEVRANLVSGNRGDAITVARPAFGTFFEASSLIDANWIGTTAGGGPLGNGANGIAVLGSDFVSVGRGNAVAYNGGAGVWVTGATADHVEVFDNLIFSNTLGPIDLGGDGVTPNDPGDADAGPNRLLNFPVITEVGAVPQTTLPVRSVVRFTLSAEPSRPYWVEFVAAPASGAGPVRPIGGVSVQTDAAGNVAAVASLAPVAAGERVSATATESSTPAGITSEYSAAVAAAPAEVYGRYLFYNHSALDGFAGGADPRDDGAIVEDHYPLVRPDSLPFSNATNYSRGLNGIMIDVARLPAGAVLSADDFEFRRGPGDGAATWVDAPAPSEITVRRGAGAGGSDRVTLVWPDAGGGPGAAVANGWLQVTMRATPDTGLSRPDVFYFGNLVGEVATFRGWQVDARDVAAVRGALDKPGGVRSTNVDLDKNGRLDARDLAIVRANFGRSLGSLTATPPTASPAASVLYGATPIRERTASPRRRAYELE